MRLGSMPLPTRYCLTELARRSDRPWLYCSVPMESVWPTAIRVSRLMDEAWAATWSRTWRPSGLRVSLSKSKKVSAFRTTLVAVGATTSVCWATGTPSHPAMPVAGVQKLLRQHSSLVPFIQTSPEEFCQLSMVCADTAPAAEKAAMASANAILEGLFMFLLVLS